MTGRFTSWPMPPTTANPCTPCPHRCHGPAGSPVTPSFTTCHPGGTPSGGAAPAPKGERLGQVAEPAARRSWRIHTLRLYDKQRTIRISELTCLWYGSFGARPVRVIWVRDIASAKTFDVALVTNDLDTPAEDLVVRYSWRWASSRHSWKPVTRSGWARRATVRSRPSNAPSRSG
ncbi:hypothetical protein AB0M95_32090 [Sphaerisporangium sp. NPDC051017]|uniref:hypothetical protein n=1 Tax=Sphaerisporangium sp. NPDC051017 TaxID=3154636 RepID=UPI0034233341